MPKKRDPRKVRWVVPGLLPLRWLPIYLFAVAVVTFPYFLAVPQSWAFVAVLAVLGTASALLGARIGSGWRKRRGLPPLLTWPPS